MHVIKDKNTQQTLYIDYRATTELLPGKSIYPAFDSANMEVGWTENTYIPAFYDIDQNGLIVEISRDEAAQRGLYQLAATEELIDGKIVYKSEEQLIAENYLDLSAIKVEMIEHYSQLAFALRTALIPDYKLQNAVLGIYDDDRRTAYRLTIDAFRNEVNRLENAIENATTIGEIRAIKPEFPDKIVTSTSNP